MGFCSSSPWPLLAATAAPLTSTTAPPYLCHLRMDSRTACTIWRPPTSTNREAARSGSSGRHTADQGTTRIRDYEMPWQSMQRIDTGPFVTAAVASSRSLKGTAKEAAWMKTLEAWHSVQNRAAATLMHRPDGCQSACAPYCIEKHDVSRGARYNALEWNCLSGRATSWYLFSAIIYRWVRVHVGFH